MFATIEKIRGKIATDCLPRASPNVVCCFTVLFYALRHLLRRSENLSLGF